MKQLYGNFIANTEALTESPIMCETFYLETKPFVTVKINDIPIRINIRGMLKLDNIEINSIIFLENVTDTYINFL